MNTEKPQISCGNIPIEENNGMSVRDYYRYFTYINSPFDIFCRYAEMEMLNTSPLPDGRDSLFYIFVEGITDVLFLSPFVGGNTVIFPMNGKTNVITAIDDLPQKERVLGVIDADFDRILGTEPPRSVLFMDNHDMDITLIMSSAFESLGQTRFGRIIVKYFGTSDNLRQYILRETSKIAVLRLWAYISDSSLGFRYIPFADIVKTPDGVPRIVDEKLLNYIISASDTSADYPDNMSNIFCLLEDNVPEIRIGDIPLNELCNGHDCINFLSFLTAYFPGPYMPPKDIRYYLLKHFTSDDFRSLNIFEEIRKYSEKNRFLILRL